MPLQVVLIGATGVFGSRIARRLSGDSRFELILVGRHRSTLEGLSNALEQGNSSTAVLDVGAVDFPHALARLHPQLVIHTAGPFQNQDYRVAEACLDCGSDYVDMADATSFVCGIRGLPLRSSRERISEPEKSRCHDSR